jgi:hypothetical protein
MKKAGNLNNSQGEQDGFRGFGDGDFGGNSNTGGFGGLDVRNKDIF